MKTASDIPEAIAEPTEHIDVPEELQGAGAPDDTMPDNTPDSLPESENIAADIAQPIPLPARVAEPEAIEQPEPAENTDKDSEPPKEQDPQDSEDVSPANGTNKPGWLAKALPGLNRVKRGILAVCLALLLAVGTGLYTVVQRNRANGAFQQGEWAAVVSAFDAAPWLKAEGRTHYAYARARLLWQEGSFADASQEMQELAQQGAFDAAELLPALEQDAALALMQQGELEQAQAAFEALGTYGDSAAYASAIATYLQANSSKDAAEQARLYASLGDFLDSEQRAADARQNVYDAAKQHYLNRDYQDALDLFVNISGFSDSALYKEACELYLSRSEAALQNRDIYARLATLAASIDVGGIMLDNAFITLYLEGEWQSERGGGFVLNPEAGYAFDSLPLHGVLFFRNGGIQQALAGPQLATFTYAGLDEFVLSMTEGEEHVFRRILE